MSFSKRPEQMRTNATRSRWRGSMFAWILNTNPVTRSSVGFTIPESLSRGCGGGWGELDERLQERLEAEVRQRAAEKHRGLSSRQVLGHFEVRTGGADHIQRL